MSKNLLYFSGVVVLILIGVYVFQQVQHQGKAESQKEQTNIDQSARNRIKNSISSYVKAVPSRYSYSELGGISGLSITVQNSSDYQLDNVQVRIDYIKADGGLWTSEYLNFTMLGSNSEQTLKAPDSNRGTSVQCFVSSIKSNALGL